MREGLFTRSADRYAGVAVSGHASGVGAAIHRQPRSDAVRRCDRELAQHPDVQQRHQAAALSPAHLSCGSSCRRFETGGHEDAQATWCRAVKRRSVKLGAVT
jgi:hypothetical protein